MKKMKKMNMRKLLKNKGETLKLTTLAFTLIELLAVIVILGIVLMIAVPGVLSIVDATKEKALGSQKKMIREAARLYITNESDVVWGGLSEKTTSISLDMLKNKGYLDKKIMNPKTKKEITCARTTIIKNKNHYDYEVDICDQVNRNPRVGSGMIPIVYDGSKWVKADVSNESQSWFNYDSQQWANVATVTESTRENYKNADVNTEVKMTDINAMFVWIPRFKYKLFNVSETVSPVGNPNLIGDMMIDVVFEDVSTSKSTGTQNGEYLTHPAFTMGGEELSGFWMAKFETGYNGASTTKEAEVNKVQMNQLVVKPNVYSWRGIQTANMMNMIMDMDTGNMFGFSKIEDPHLVKNIEWGAMAYLTNSKYGKTGNSSYSGVEKEVRMNNNSQHLTGCGAGVFNEAMNNICNRYETNSGQASSTTGNITGVYDTNGGAWDVVASFAKDDSSHFYLSQTGFTQEQLDELGRSNRYTDVYPLKKNSLDFRFGILGDATKELGPFKNVMSSWFSDYGVFPASSSNSGLARGGASEEIIERSGIMAFYPWSGVADPTIGSRIVII